MINDTFDSLRNFFNSGKTRDVNFRINQLKNLYKTIKHHKFEIEEALYNDLKKSDFEIYTTEIGIILKEINYALKNIKKWVKPQKIHTPFYLQPSKGYILKEPYGIVLIIAPFNYPFQLTFLPLIGAIAAGNCAIVKPSKRTPNCNKIINKIILETFDENYIKCIMPSCIDEKELSEAYFDYIFFTGSSSAGKIIAESAAKKLIPYTLELGGKSPVIVDNNVNLNQAAKKIIWGKFLNAGQTCIAPDFILVRNDIKSKFIEELINSIKVFYGSNPLKSDDYGRIIDIDSFKRLTDLISKEKNNIIFGGLSDENNLYIEPTILNINSYNSPSMQEEIFGPVLPVLTYSNIDSVIKELRQKPKPLALYVFTKDKKFYKKIINNIQFGGGAVNDTIEHVSTEKMPFGGIGNSGEGQYHGKYSFYTFTHLKSILLKNPNYDIGLFYPPYSSRFIKIIKFFFS